jgi:hypothetical protein
LRKDKQPDQLQKQARRRKRAKKRRKGSKHHPTAGTALARGIHIPAFAALELFEVSDEVKKRVLPSPKKSTQLLANGSKFPQDLVHD